MNPLPSLKQLHYLVVLSEQLNFTRAAQTCFVTQSTLSAGLKELEDALGTKLVERDRQTVLMTPIGEDVAKRARTILAATQDLVQVANRSKGPMEGLLRLGVIPTIAPFLLPPCLQLLRQRYPDLQLALREDRSASLLARLEDGHLDFALIALPYETGNFHVESLFDDTLWLVAHKSDPVAKSRSVAATPALIDRVLLLEDGHCLREHTLYACGVADHRPPEAMQATTLLTLVEMIESGLGLGLIPEMAVRRGLADSPNLISRPMAKPSPKRRIALVARRTTPRLADMKALADAIKAVHAATTSSSKL